MRRAEKNIRYEISMFTKALPIVLITLFPMMSWAKPLKEGIDMDSYYTKNELILSGRLLTFFLTAYNEFTKENKELANFEVLILENDTEVRVTFVPMSASGEKTLGGRTSLGKSVSYYVSRSNNKITRWHYHR